MNLNLKLYQSNRKTDRDWHTDKDKDWWTKKKTDRQRLTDKEKDLQTKTKTDRQANTRHTDKDSAK